MTVHVRFQQTLPLRVPEWILAGMMLFWGWNVLSHIGMFAGNPAFRAMLNIMPQSAWGSGALALGLAGLVGLAINGFWKATPFIRAASAFGRAFLWLQIHFGIYASGTPSTGTVVYLGLVSLEIWNIYRAMGDARTALTK